jgi:RAD51-like protein 2
VSLVIRGFAYLLESEASRVLQGIHLVRIPTQVQMIAFLHLLDEWVDEHPQVRSISVPSR